LSLFQFGPRAETYLGCSKSNRNPEGIKKNPSVKDAMPLTKTIPEFHV